ncbi:DinB family protein [Chryseobacterium lactis]|uniref:DinB family protein n=1 Tax=Chryseobacterium lactis TaxID=1241981 RepID=A0A3G6REW3_CHRLC|nr:DinB family protein [Chryseobacterium lactis]AZA82276.1 DinB family protein [Chryseobacterium lactis]AZB02658.1 DinB family protein [Chryseobacterium lactis]PNW14050.1 DinB family protein [Chryseobacterium lactis]
MDIFRLIQDIKTHLKLNFDEVDRWFEKDKNILNDQPLNKGWTVQQILEHIYLTNFYLLILIEKGTKKAMRNYKDLDLQSEIKNYSFNKEHFGRVGEYGAFEWIRPEHMEPKGELNLPEIRRLISQQYHQCLDYLDLMKNGEGLLCKTTMTVDGLGKINVYEYIYFLSLHARRHITQMKNNELETIKKLKQ